MKKTGDEQEKLTSDDTFEFLKSARDIAFLFAVFLYFMGWIYIYYFLESFGLSVKAMDVDIYNLLIYSSNVFIFLYHNQKVVIALVLIVFVLIGLFGKYLKFFYGIFPLLIITLFPIAFFYAKAAGTDSAQRILDDPRKTLKRITFIFKDLKTEPAPKKGVAADDSLVKFNNDGRKSIINQSKGGSFRLLVANKDEYYILQVTGHYDKTSPTIYMIKKDMIEYAIISK